MATVSIIIPSFRQPQFLGRAIESCLEQDHTDLEIIVIDDRSRDASLGLALSMAHADSRIIVLEPPANGGLGRARNIGLAHATGDYLCFLDSDDYLLPRSISARLDAFPAASEQWGENLVAVYGDWQHVGESMDYPVVRAPRTTMTVVDAASYTGENAFICSAPLVRRQPVLDAGGFPEGLPMLEDFGLWSKMIAAGAVFAPVHHVVATYRQRPNSMLRGENGITMASYVDVINQWMEDSGTLIADGGAMAAWLDDRPPQSYGRMSWNASANLDSAHKIATAGSLRSSAVRDEQDAPGWSGVDDFMNNPVNTGLTTELEPWSGAASAVAPNKAIVVQSLSDSLAAVGLLGDWDSGDGDSTAASGADSWSVFADDPTDWANLWPLALAGVAVRSTALIDTFSTPPQIVDRSTVGLFTSRSPVELVERGAAQLWPDPRGRSGSVVYVPAGFEEYPALDAWVSTALHALADRGLSPTIMAEPQARPCLGGYRSELTSISRLLEAVVVVAAPFADRLLLDALAPTIIFDPSAPAEPAGPTTATALGSALDSLDL